MDDDEWRKPVSRVSIRWADAGDLPAIQSLMALAIERLQAPFLSPEQIAASHAIMGLDTQLIDDGTYIVAERDGIILGCGGWSWRATLYGGDHSADLRDTTRLDPSIDAARIRAMYTHPDVARQGVGRAVLRGCEMAAAGAGFRAAELMATASGQPLYAACGYRACETADTDVAGVTVPLVRMRKELGAIMALADEPHAGM
jgi:GNAT superfamily N-acetyltransferase